LNLQLAAASVLLICLLIDAAVSFRLTMFFRTGMPELEALGDRLIRELQRSREEYEEQYRLYDNKNESYRRDWRRRIEEAKAGLLKDLNAGGEVYRQEVEQANEDLRLILRTLKKDMEEAANRRDAVIRAEEENLRQAIRQELDRRLRPRHRRGLYRLLKAYPGMLLLPDSKGRAHRNEEPQANGTGLSHEADVVRFIWNEVKESTFIRYKALVKRNHPLSIEKSTGGVNMKFVCTACGYVYDPAVGDPDSGVAPGTAFESVAEDWVCPICGVGKDLFEAQE